MTVWGPDEKAMNGLVAQALRDQARIHELELQVMTLQDTDLSRTVFALQEENHFLRIQLDQCEAQRDNSRRAIAAAVSDLEGAERD